jgi:hypothetical protein
MVDRSFPTDAQAQPVHPEGGIASDAFRIEDRSTVSEQPPPPENETSPQAAPTQAESQDTHPVRLIVRDDLKRSRLTVFFRLLLAIPHFIWISLWGIAAFLVLIVGWFAALFAGRLPEGIHDFLGRYQVYTTHFNAYFNLLGNPYPKFTGRTGTYPVDLHVDPPERQSRWKIGFRIILAIPAIILTWVFQQVLSIIAFLGWFACLVLGRMPKGMRDLGVYCLRYQEQTYCYLALLTGRYPSLTAPTL